jgi:hypothetical protein
MTVRILYDGWPLAYEPLSAGAWHMRTLLALKPEGVDAVLAMPTEPQAGLNPGVRMAFEHTHDQGEWEQRILPRFAQEAQAHIHTTGLASLFGKARTFASRADGESQRGRLAEAQGRGGLERAVTLWPQDLPAPRGARLLPPSVFPEFGGQSGVLSKLNLPDEYILVHGVPDETAAMQLLESWTWAAASVGEFYPLVIVGLSGKMRTFIQARLPEFHVEGSVRLLEILQPQELPAIYQASTAIAHVGKPAVWGNGLRHALAVGKALVAQDDEYAQGIVGAAGYLLPPKDLRGYGAAMITVVVDEKAREKLEDAARAQAARWRPQAFTEELLKAYQGF